MIALAGGNFIHGAGLLESWMTVSYEQMVIDDEILGMIARCLRGIEVNDETLALDIINGVGPGGHFLAQKHTLRHAGSEYFMPSVGDRFGREDWEKLGGKDTAQKAGDKTKAILLTSSPSPLLRDVDIQLQRIMTGVEKRAKS